MASEFEINWIPFEKLLSHVVDNRGRTCPTSETGIPLIATNCIRNKRLYPTYEKVRYVSKDTYDTWFRGHPKPGDIIFVNKGTPGRTCLVPNPINFCIAQDMVAVRADESKVDPLYLFATLRSPQVQTEIANMHVGTLIPHFKKGDFKKLRIPVHRNKDIQKAIGHIYFSFCEKIDHNEKMNQILEAMARAIFKSWFVDFDPVRAKAEGRDPGLSKEIADLFPDSFQDSDLGEIPKGWEILPLPKVLDVNPKRNLKKGEIAPYLEMKNMPEYSARVLDWYNRKFGSGSRFINGDTLMARITPCLENGKGAFVDFLEDGQVGWGSTEYIVFRSRAPLPVEYAYFFTRTEDFRTHAIVNMTGSSGRQRVPASVFASYLAVKPRKEVAWQLGETVRPLMEKMKRNDEESGTLSTLRDTLLPKLISGELRLPAAALELAAQRAGVPDAEKLVEASI